MHRSAPLGGLVLGLVVVLLAAAASSVTADPAEDALRGKGLVRRGGVYCLPEELDLGKSIAGVRPESFKKKKAVDDAQAAAAAAQAKFDELEKTFHQGRQAYDQLNIQYSALPPQSSQANRLAQQINQLVALLNAAPGQLEQADRSLKEVRTAAARQREEFIQYVLNLRQQLNQLDARYRQLATDPEVKKVLDQAAQEGKKLALGPMKSTADAIRKLESSVITDAVPIHKEPGGTWAVFVSINEQPALALGIDTGASLVVLPYKVAETVGLSINSDSPTIKLQLADGETTIEAQLATAKTVRLGRFSLKNVQCAVLPGNLPNAPALLGMTFLGQFNFKIDKEQSKLVLSAVGAAGSSRDAKSKTDEGPVAAGSEAAPAAEQAPQTPAEKLAALLALPAEQAEGLRELRTASGPTGKPLVFKPCRQGPAKTLQERFGDPDEIRKIPSPERVAEGVEAASWKLWTWGSILVLVDDAGTTRYFALVEP